jgi:photosystem II stability/assembly factor-like uncharacterized protein
MQRIFTTALFLFLTLGSLHSQSWEKINTGFNYILMGIEFPGGQSLIGYAGGESLTYMGDGIVIKTTDGGTSWSQLWTGTNQGIEGISFPDLNTGYVCGWSGYFAKTTNGGSTWNTQTPGNDIYYYTDVVFKDAQHGVAFAQTNSGAGVYVTSNGGSTWTTATGVAGIPYGACYVSGSTYYLVTNGGSIQRSVNDGLSWSTVYTGAGLLLGIDFYNSNIGIAAGEDGWIYKTFDGGATWQPQQTAFGNPLWHDFAWATQQDVYSVGTPETIWKSTNGGTTWANDYPQSTYNPALYEIIHTDDDVLYVCGSQGWFYRKASPVNAAFSANHTLICQGGSVQFTDQSTGSPTSWNWTFEGGNPATSTQQNPVVTYPTSGTFDVTLVASRGGISGSSSQVDFIHVESPVLVAPSQPTGAAVLCGLFPYSYSTTSVPNATAYSWTVNPTTAGSFSGNGVTSTLNTSNNYQGDFTVMVAGNNSCGNGPLSNSLNAVLNFTPNPYFISQGGEYCPGTTGVELFLEDSDPSVTYELLNAGVATGLTFQGTGELLSLGFHTSGEYTVFASSASCTNTMYGIAYVSEKSLPAQPAVPTGMNPVCNNSTSVYSCPLLPGTDSLTWILTPTEAGLITSAGQNVTISWSAQFSGEALLSAAGINSCGVGPASLPLTILAESTPLPVISGYNEVCQLALTEYKVEDHPGSNYNWEVNGGTIISGQGTATLMVLWGAAGDGSVSLIETSVTGCSSPLMNFAVQINICPGFKENQAEDFLVYPNPASTFIDICCLEGIINMRVIDAATGSEIPVHSEQATENQKRILVDNLADGCYFLLLKDESCNTYRARFIVLKK